MAQGDRPLLARNESNESSIREASEEDALLTGQSTSKSEPTRFKKYREAGLSLYAILATIAIIVLSIAVHRKSKRADPHHAGKGWGPDGKPMGKRNLIFMVSDGMGPASLSLTRSFRQYTDGLPIDDILVLDQHLIGNSRTRSSSSLVTDSAAGATAFSCGLKSYNGAISVLPDHTPCGTVLEAAKRAGYMTGLVVTTRVTDATPACFASHANRREYEDLIAEQMIGNYPLGRMVDLIIGGGRCFFLPNSTDGSCRSDSTDVVKMAIDEYGFNYIDNRKDFDKLRSRGRIELPLLALLANRDIPFEVDRVHVDDVYPSESEMAELALRTLAEATEDSEKGFFLMIEGSRVDHAGHFNDPGAQVREVLAHDKAFAAVLDFLDDSDIPGVLVSTSDHETGGLSVARQLGLQYPQYRWFPSVLANASHSAEYLARKWNDFLFASTKKSPSRKQKYAYIKSRLSEDLGITDATSEEINSVIDATPFNPPLYLFADMISRRAQIGWSTHGHSAVDVNIYASDPRHAAPLIGNHENIEVGKFLAEFLDVDVDEVTKMLQEKGVKTQPGNAPEEGVLSRTREQNWMGPEQLPNDSELLAKWKDMNPWHHGLPGHAGTDKEPAYNEQ